jgi:hypothetical protein
MRILFAALVFGVWGLLALFPPATGKALEFIPYSDRPRTEPGRFRMEVFERRLWRPFYLIEGKAHGSHSSKGEFL